MRFTTKTSLQGFLPSSSIIRVGTNFYMSSVAADWRKGIHIFHSYDLKNWKLVRRLFEKSNHENQERIYHSRITYHKNGFCIIYKEIYHDHSKKTFMIVAESISDKWSKPLCLNYSGSDASTFYDYDGSTWVIKIVPSQRVFPFSSIIMQEFDAQANRLKNTAHILVIENRYRQLYHPLLFSKNGYYHLMVSDERNQTCILRSKYLKGPYVECLHDFLSNTDEDAPTEQNLVRTLEGTWYLSFDDKLNRPYVGLNSRLESAMQTKEGNIILRWKNKIFK